MTARAKIDEMAEYMMGQHSERQKARRKVSVGKVRLTLGKGRFGKPEQATKWELRFTIYGKNYSIKSYEASGHLPASIVRRYGLEVGTAIDPAPAYGPAIDYPTLNFGGWNKNSTVNSVMDEIAADPGKGDVLRFFIERIVPLIKQTVDTFSVEDDLPKVFMGKGSRADLRFTARGRGFRLALNKYRFTRAGPGAQLERFVQVARKPEDVLAKVEIADQGFPSTFWVLLNPEELDSFKVDIQRNAREHVGGILGR